MFASESARNVLPMKSHSALLPRIFAISAALSPGELQFVLLLTERGLAALIEEDGGRFYLLDASVHRALAESLADRRLPLRASAAQPAGG